MTPHTSGRNLPAAWNHPTGFNALPETFEQRLTAYRTWCRAGAAPDTETWIGLDTPDMQDRLARLVEQARHLEARTSPSAAAARLTLVRADTDLNDVLVTPDDRLVLVDWDASGWGDPAFDLACLRCHPQNQGLSASQWRGMRSAYVPPPGDETFSQRLQAWEGLLMCDWCLLTLARLVEVAQRKLQRRGAGVPERMVRSVRQRFDYYLATAEAHLAAP